MSGNTKYTITLDRGNETSCRINLHGATVTSWIVAGQERLFVSKKAIFDNKTPIMGGIPIVFPRFADWGEKPFHGFARICRWLIESEPKKTASGDLHVQLKLLDTAWTRSFWDFTFSLTLDVTLGENELRTDITVSNPSTKREFSFDLLLHTFLSIPDVTLCTISGFKGTSYLDKTQNFVELQENNDVITVKKFTDNIYKSTLREHVISNTFGGKSLRLVKSNYPDTVVWNPWSNTVGNFPDLESSEYRHFFCIEAGNVVKPVSLGPGKSFKASQVLQLI